MKTCTKCDETKEPYEFYSHTSNLDGRSGSCKSCKRLYAAKRYAELSNEPADSKDCSRCGEHKQASEFVLRPASNSGLASYCKACQREGNLMRKYDMTLADFDEMFEAQGGCCAICAVDTPGGRGRFHVDHCHKTNVVRGLLCHNCNTSLGGFQDSKVNLAAAIIYLEVHEP